MYCSRVDWVIGFLILVFLPLLGAGVIISGDIKRNNEQILIKNTEQELSGFGSRFEVSIPIKETSVVGPVAHYKTSLDIKAIKDKYLRENLAEVSLLALALFNATVLTLLLSRNKRKNKCIKNCDNAISAGVYLTDEKTLNVPCKNKKFIISVDTIPASMTDENMIINQHAVPDNGTCFYTRRFTEHEQWTPWICHST